jgi:hypothetical protein
MQNGGVGCDVYLMGTPRGVCRARAFKQMPEPLCWNVEFYLAVVGAPWGWDGPTTASLRVVIPNVSVPLTMPDAATPAQPRRVYIRRHNELLKHVYTSGCGGCIAAAGGLDPRGHTDECRIRIESVMEADTANDGQVRVTVAHERLNPVPSTLVVRTMSTAAPMGAEEHGGKRARSTAAASADQRASPAAMDTTASAPTGQKRKPPAGIIQGYPDEGALASTVTTAAG